jgi:hypothetical protein
LRSNIANNYNVAFGLVIHQHAKIIYLIIMQKIYWLAKSWNKVLSEKLIVG